MMTIWERIRIHWKEWTPVALGVAMLVLTIFAYLRLLESRKPVRVTFSTGGKLGFRYHLFHTMPEVGRVHGLVISTDIEDSTKAMAMLDAGTCDFALIQGGFDLSRHPNLRLATPMMVETMHLLVKEKLTEEVGAHLGALRGKRLLLGSNPRTGGHFLAVDILKFVGLNPPADGSPGDYFSEAYPLKNLDDSTPPEKWPDAVFLMSIPPAAQLKRLVTTRRYRLVALPLARAYVTSSQQGNDAVPQRLSGEHPAEDAVRRESVIEQVIPAYTYQVDPAVPPVDLPTIGTRLLLVTHRAVRPKVVERMLDTLFDESFRSLLNPSIDPALLQEAPALPLHPGAILYRDRGKPIVTDTLVGTLANTVTVVGPLSGTVLFLWHWVRQFTRRNRERAFESAMKRVRDIETRAVAEERSSAPDREHLFALQDELARLKSAALDHFCQGEIMNPEQLSSVLNQVNHACDTISRLIAHQRDSCSEPSRDSGTAPAFASGVDTTRSAAAT
ncbi:MAG: hypothetical protein P4L84_31485 [Isosphaeraceae bacterium]|nr:hypothetical protein [Isosphaeraceae bacterium]